MKVGIYARVSGRSQAMYGSSIEEQVRACRQWARDNRHRIVAIYRDPGVSGTLLERPELARAILDAKARRLDGIVVFDLDRLARDLIVQETIIAELDRSGVELHSLNQPNLEGDDPSRKFARQIFGAVAEYHRVMTVLRLRLGRQAARSSRGFSEGQARFGYRKTKGTISPHPDEQIAVDVIRRARGEHKTLRQICRELETRGIAPRRGARWHPETVRRILRYDNRPYERARRVAT